MSHVDKFILCQDDSASDSRAAFPPSANSKNDSQTHPLFLIGYPTSAQFVIHDKATHRPSANFWKATTLRTAWRTAILDNNFHPPSAPTMRPILLQGHVRCTASPLHLEPAANKNTGACAHPNQVCSPATSSADNAIRHTLSSTDRSPDITATAISSSRPPRISTSARGTHTTASASAPITATREPSGPSMSTPPALSSPLAQPITPSGYGMSRAASA